MIIIIFEFYQMYLPLCHNDQIPQAPHERMAYRCSFCGIIFDSISHRERHEQRHKDNDTFECEDCHKMFKNEKNLRHHYKTHHELPHPKKTTGAATGKPE